MTIFGIVFIYLQIPRYQLGFGCILATTNLDVPIFNFICCSQGTSVQKGFYAAHRDGALDALNKNYKKSMKLGSRQRKIETDLLHIHSIRQHCL